VLRSSPEQEGNRLASLDQVEVGDVLWGYSFGWWRRVRVIRKGRTRVAVEFNLQGGGARREARLGLSQLRRFAPGGRPFLRTAEI
jgi:hypothetical protein